VKLAAGGKSRKGGEKSGASSRGILLKRGSCSDRLWLNALYRRREKIKFKESRFGGTTGLKGGEVPEGLRFAATGKRKKRVFGQKTQKKNGITKNRAQRKTYLRQKSSLGDDKERATSKGT